MRDFNEGDNVTGMFLEHYPGMTEKALETICQQAMNDYPILDCIALHRVGDIQPNDSIVLVAAWSAHRGAAFDACRYIIDETKTRLPIWKKEHYLTGISEWVNCEHCANAGHSHDHSGDHLGDRSADHSGGDKQHG